MSELSSTDVTRLLAEPLSCGKYYIVCSSWFFRYKDYLASPDYNPSPGAISNAHLLVDNPHFDPSASTSSHLHTFTSSSKSLHPSAHEGPGEYGYDIIPPQIWSHISSTFTYDVSIPRLCHLNPLESTAFCEVNPTLIKFFRPKHKNSSTTHPHIVKFYTSKYVSTSSLLKIGGLEFNEPKYYLTSSGWCDNKPINENGLVVENEDLFNPSDDAGIVVVDGEWEVREGMYPDCCKEKVVGGETEDEPDLYEDLPTATGVIIPAPPTPPPNHSNVSSLHSSPDRSPLHPPKKQKFPGRTGLTNLGNTCFMNSSLQCLSHTPPLRDYFLSRKHVKSLNTTNVLGTGGSLAEEFSKLMSELWDGKDTDARPNTSYSGYGGYSSYSSGVAPRNFKKIIGSHATRFAGYEQHDSHELTATVLDFLHEDTNEVLKKPYIEKPEAGDDEPDKEAADKAWNVHLQREKSFVYRIFQGQLKNVMTCPNVNCDRVSTTFDPFMYLTVELPGSNTTTVEYAFVDISGKATRSSAVMGRETSLSQLRKSVSEKFGVGPSEMVVCDIWKNGIFKEFTKDGDSVGAANDNIFVYQIEPAGGYGEQEEEEEKESKGDAEYSDDQSLTALKPYVNSTAQLSFFLKNNKQNEADNYIKEARVLLEKLDSALNEASDSDSDNATGGVETTTMGTVYMTDDTNEACERICNQDFKFKNINTRTHYNIFKAAIDSFQLAMSRAAKKARQSFSNGMVLKIQNYVKNEGWSYSSNEPFSPPFVMRISPNTTVWELREKVSNFLGPFMKKKEVTTAPMEDGEGKLDDDVDDGFPILKACELQFEKDGGGRTSYNPTNLQTLTAAEGPDDLEEKKLVLDYLNSEKGMLKLQWPASEVMKLDMSLMKAKDEGGDNGKEEEGSGGISLVDCIRKFSVKEQLEETEMWYCNKCKESVPAFKQLSIWKAPPILIIQLKRFLYRASSHFREKIDTLVDFPLEGLDMGEFILERGGKGGAIYDCYAVSNHFGGLGGGHYTAYALNGGSWCDFDDSRVTKDIDPSKVVSSAAYCLYYKLRDMDLGEGDDDSGTDVRTEMEKFVLDNNDGEVSSSSNNIDSMYVEVSNNGIGPVQTDQIAGSGSGSDESGVLVEKEDANGYVPELPDEPEAETETEADGYEGNDDDEDDGGNPYYGNFSNSGNFEGNPQ
ncbi:hypothetical protein TrVE_jg13600 [Triparma verrucosa]|uniref:Ubiquitinyl hydrolase 1 n=1 Tax=Triparma verrucosa TaxID=1606542 RepID=A0A9W7B6R9_9STRA|nr:hypothetical protein TrVE_jg13600 [Triparma verrucosa]